MHEILASADFRFTSQVALLDFLAGCEQTADPAMAAAMHHRMAGAQAFLEVLYKIATPPMVRERPQPANQLDYNA